MINILEMQVVSTRRWVPLHKVLLYACVLCYALPPDCDPSRLFAGFALTHVTTGTTGWEYILII